MPIDTLLSLAFYAFVTTVTPGPNNLMLLASGVNFGLKRTLPHIAGIIVGFALLVFAVGFGFAELFRAFPPLYTVVRIVGALYLIWLAWRIATAPAPSAGESRGKPLSFLGAALFQWVNPKAWVMAVGASANYLPAEANITLVLIVALTCTVVNAPSVGIWAVFGAALQGWLGKPRNRRVFNVVMAVLLLGSLYPMLTAELS